MISKKNNLNTNDTETQSKSLTYRNDGARCRFILFKSRDILNNINFAVMKNNLKTNKICP